LNVAHLTNAQLTGLTTGLTKMTTAQIGALSASQVDALSATQIGTLNAAQIGALSASTVGTLSTAQVARFTVAEVGALSSGDIAAMSNSQVAAFTATQINALTPSAIGALTSGQIGGLANAVVGALSTTTLNALSATQIGEFSTAQTGALTAAQLNGLGAANLNALNASSLTTVQVKGLTAATVGNLTAANFDKFVVPNLASLSTAAVTGITTAQLQSLSSSQIGQFTSAQLTAMTPAQNVVLTGNNPILAEAASMATNGALSYNDLLDVLQNAATGGMTAIKFQGLQALASDLNNGKSSGFTTSAYDQQIFDDVVDGNSANAKWNGGSGTATALGNMTASSSAAQINELIGKWFLGTDLPSINVTTGNVGENEPAAYEAVNDPLFSPSGPSYLDVNQGNTGDCYFLAALAETAKQDPNVIKNMIQSNGNNTYSVEFQINGKADYVTVNNELPILQNGYAMANGATEEFDNSTTLWSPLIEKAYAELMEQTNVIPGGSLNVNGNSYADIAGGGGQGLTEITGQSYTTYGTTPGENTVSASSMLTALQSALASGQDVIMGTTGLPATGNLVADHMFEVTGVNATAGTVTLQNPWNGSGEDSGLAMAFTTTIASLAADEVTFMATTGRTTVV
jgi:Calpain family cysteine protease/ALTTAQ repeat